ncbi:MAG: hypothetical protein GW859_09985 [Sphingomonadales bacterium]|nr:hypothetical protein [Sphingomonadales bacterium]
MKTSILAVAAALLCAATPASAGDVSAIADAFKAMVGQKFDDDIVLRKVEVEGDLVILVLDGPEAWRGGADANDLSDSFFEGFCEDGDDIFDGAFALRVDTTEAGADRRAGRVVDSCDDIATDSAA